MEVFTEFGFEAAHRLLNLPEGHKCSRLHGHSYRVQVRVRGDVDPHTGMVVDFAAIQDACAPVRQKLDHYYLNDIAGLTNPTSENLARWIWDQLRTSPVSVSRVVVRETCTSGAEYGGEDDPE